MAATAEIARSLPAADDRGQGLLRLRIYAAALGIAFLLYLAAEGPGQGTLFWSASGAALAAIVFGSFAARSAVLRHGAIALFAIAMIVPLAPLLAQGGSLSSGGSLWPQILVALFASRVLAEENSLRFALFWRAPLLSRGLVQMQSLGAAVALGFCLTLFYYEILQLLGLHRSGETSMSAILLNALTGETAVHRTIVVLFFIIVAFICDAAADYLRDRVTLRSVQTALMKRPPQAPLGGRQDVLAFVEARFGDLAHTRMLFLLREAMLTRGGGGAVLGIEAFAGFHGAARRFVKGLLPFLPLLGFFGTVVGLATAMAALPHSTGENGAIDISASLAGLAVKFETTLLGIAASMIAALLLALLERREAELAAECALFVDYADAAHG